MPFDASVATALSNAFRSACTTRLTSPQLLEFERLLQSILGIKNLRNVQLWTRFGSVQRNIINRNLGEYELDYRTWIVLKFLRYEEPSFPVKRKPFLMPLSSDSYKKISEYFNSNWVREYGTRIFFTDYFFIIEYAADSNTGEEEVDLDSPEFEDLLE